MNLQKTPKDVISTICEFPTEVRHKILKVALAVIHPKLQDRTKAIERISTDYNISKETVIAILGVHIAIIRLFLTTSDKEFNSKLSEIGFTTDFIENLPLVSNRAEVVQAISILKSNEYGKLASLKWRLDISLINSSLRKKLPVSVTLNLTLKDGRKFVIEINGRTFHKLRYNVALLLKEFNTVKSNFVTNK